MLCWCFNLPKRVLGIITPSLILVIVPMFVFSNDLLQLSLVAIGVLLQLLDWMNIRLGEVYRWFRARKSKVVRNHSIHRFNNQRRVFDALNH